MNENTDRYFIDNKEVKVEFFTDELKRMKGLHNQVVDYLLAGFPVNVEEGGEKHEFKITRDLIYE